VRERRATNRNTLTLSAGDLIGASPLLSALYHDEPTIEAMNLIGLDYNSVGNDEFDEGADELRRMQDGGCHPTEGCKDGDGFAGADFGFLAANVIDRRTGRPFFPPYAIRKVDIVEHTTQDVDLFLTGHTHQAYNCVIDGRPVTSASSNGRLLTDLDLTISGRTKDVVGPVTADNVPILTGNRKPASDVQSLIDRYDQLSAPLRRTPVGRISQDIDRELDASRENEAGNLIADAQLADTDDADRGGAVGALMNPGGVREIFKFAQSGNEGDGVVTYEEAFTVQPFNNIVATQTYTGAQLLDVLKDQWCGTGQTSPTVLLPSKNYSFSQSVASGILGKPTAGTASAR
jgi:2',3'-cyclic-nucleotide 2'-phosphodiesterase (5'-nucleotidase family)